MLSFKTTDLQSWNSLQACFGDRSLGERHVLKMQSKAKSRGEEAGRGKVSRITDVFRGAGRVQTQFGGWPLLGKGSGVKNQSVSE